MKDFEFIKVKLVNKLKNELPGIESHKKMFPANYSKKINNYQIPENVKKSSVSLILNINKNNELSIIFTLRSSKLNNHSGQISFPGGRKDENETLLQTAIRETKEEIGIDLNEEDNIGSLTELYVPPSNSVIYPYVFIKNQLEEFTLNPDEVEELFLSNLDYLISESALKSHRRNFDDKNEYDIPHYDVHPNVPLWGATAIILTEFLDIYRSAIEE